MKTIIDTLLLALVLGTSGNVCAQKTKGGIFNLAGYTLKDGGVLKKGVEESFQGFAIHKGYMVGLYNGGFASLYKIHSDGTYMRLSTFPLGSNSKYNHANVANFGVEKYKKRRYAPAAVCLANQDRQEEKHNRCLLRGTDII